MQRNIAPALVLMGSLAILSPAPTAPHLNAQVLLAPSSYLGVGIMEVGPGTAKEIGLLDPHGVEISSVADRSPAEKAGLRRGDIVVTYRAERVNGIEHFARLVKETPVGGDVELGVVRGRDRLAIDVEIGKREIGLSVPDTIDAVKERIAVDKEQLDAVRKRLDSVKLRLKADGWSLCDECPNPLSELGIEIDMSFPSVRLSLRNQRLGIELEEVEGQLADFFGVGNGVLVRQVRVGSPASRAGLRAGDVIVSVGDEAVRRTADVGRAVSSWEEAGKIPVKVVRDREPTRLLLDPGTREKPVSARPVSVPD